MKVHFQFHNEHSIKSSINIIERVHNKSVTTISLVSQESCFQGCVATLLKIQNSRPTRCLTAKGPLAEFFTRQLRFDTGV